jgi:cell division protein FtsL
MEQMRSGATSLETELFVDDSVATLSSDLSKFETSLNQTTMVRPTASVHKNFKASLNTRGKIIVITYALIVALLGFLLIYNAFSMAAVTASIAATEILISEEKATIDELTMQLGELNNPDLIMERVNGSGYVPAQTRVSGVTTSVGEAITYEAQTNWFDKICDFISSIFSK